jgi:outer membrane receptor for monomeric catechols
VPVTLLGTEGQAYLGFDGSYRSSSSSNSSPSAYTNVDGYALTNFRFGFRTEKGIDVYGWVRNAFDVNYYDQLAVAPGNTGLIGRQHRRSAHVWRHRDDHVLRPKVRQAPAALPPQFRRGVC